MSRGALMAMCLLTLSTSLTVVSAASHCDEGMRRQLDSEYPTERIRALQALAESPCVGLDDQVLSCLHQCETLEAALVTAKALDLEEAVGMTLETLSTASCGLGANGSVDPVSDIAAQLVDLCRSGSREGQAGRIRRCIQTFESKGNRVTRDQAREIALIALVGMNVPNIDLYIGDVGSGEDLLLVHSAYESLKQRSDIQSQVRYLDRCSGEADQELRTRCMKYILSHGRPGIADSARKRYADGTLSQGEWKNLQKALDEIAMLGKTTKVVERTARSCDSEKMASDGLIALVAHSNPEFESVFDQIAKCPANVHSVRALCLVFKGYEAIGRSEKYCSVLKRVGEYAVTHPELKSLISTLNSTQLPSDPAEAEAFLVRSLE